MLKKQILFSAGVLILIVLSFGIVRHLNQNPTAPTPTKTTSQKNASPAFNTHQYSITDPASLWIVVNKARPLQPASYVPAQLVVPAIPLRLGASNSEMEVSSAMAAALERMVAAASQANVKLMLASGYRSYNLQVSVYGSIVSSQGQAAADQQSARPGHSEHQTGLAADLEPVSRQCEVEQCFADLPEGKWLAANAYLYGFIIRYPANKTSITGYEYEPWHVRYVGVDLATQMHTQGTETLEEFFGLPAAPDYL